jgi:hypothetical protein
MRTATAPELVLLAAPAVQYHTRVRIEDPDGVMLDVVTGEGRLGGLCWLDGCEIDVDIDQPVSQAVIRIVRAAGATLSMVPLMTASTLNRNAASAYAPFLELGRAVRIEVAATAIGGTPISSDWKNLFEGEIDRISTRGNPIVLTCRDLGGRLVDTWTDSGIGVDVPEGGTPVPLETLMQQNLTVGVTSPTVALYTPVSPGFSVSRFVVERGMPVMDVMQKLAQDAIGWDARYKWDEGTNSWRFTLYEPPRSKVIPDATIGPSQYIDVAEMAIDRTNIRNTVYVFYTESEGQYKGKRMGGSPGYGFAADPVSQDTYGFRPLRFEESSESPIDTAAEAQALADKVLADLKDPKADQEIEMFLFWPAELHDLYRFTPNGVHYDSNQDWAVVNVRHVLTPTSARTRLQVRGKPAGRYRGWLARQFDPFVPDTEPVLTLSNFRWTESADGNYRDYAWEPGPDVAVVWVYDNIYPIPLQPLPGRSRHPWPELADTPTTFLNADTTTFRVARPAAGYGRFTQFTPRATALPGGVITAGESYKATLLGPGAYGLVETSLETTAQATVTSVITDPGLILHPTTPVRFYVTRLGVTTLVSPTSAPSMGTTGTYTRVEAQDPKHQITIQPLYTYVDGGIDYGAPYVFDSDKVANVTVTQAYADAVGRLTAVFDTDTALGAGNGEYDVDLGTPVALTIPSNRTVAFDVAQSPAARKSVRVRGKNPAGSWGPYFTLEVDQIETVSGGANNTFSSLTNVIFSYPADQVDLGWTWNGGGTPDFKVYVRETPGSAFNLVATVTASTYRYTAGHDLVASGGSTSTTISFYVQALSAGVVLATSTVKAATYSANI